MAFPKSPAEAAQLDIDCIVWSRACLASRLVGMWRYANTPHRR